MIRSTFLKLSVALAWLAAGTAVGSASDNAYDYDSPVVAKRATLTLETQSASEDAAQTHFAQQADFSDNQSSRQNSKTDNARASSSRQNSQSRPSDTSHAADNTQYQGQYTANTRSGSNRNASENSRAAAPTSGASLIQEPNLLPPNVNGKSNGLAIRSAPATQSRYPANLDHASGNMQASYSTSAAVPGANPSIGTSATTPRTNTQRFASRGMSNETAATTIAQTPQSVTVEPRVGSRISAGDSSTNMGESSTMMGGSSAMSSQPESMPPGTPLDLSMNNDAWGDGSDCGSDCGWCFNPCGNCGWYADIDYLLLRPTFSEQQAYLKRTTVTDVAENTIETDTVVHDDFGYNSSVRISFGYRFCDCGGEIKFTYWNYGNSSRSVTGIAPDDGSIIYAGQLELNAPPGGRLIVSDGIQMNVYDIEYGKCICNPGNGCCQNSCSCCPPWTLKYFAGIRIADVRRGDDTLSTDPEGGSGGQAAFITADFIGAGPRVGLEGRRFFEGGRTSLYAKTNFSLLLGEYDVKETRKTPASSPTLTENYFDSHDRIIPEAEIELGGSWQVSQNISLSVGYLFQAWWDLGQFEQIEGNVFLNPLDDANIMSFDGLVARLEITF